MKNKFLIDENEMLNVMTLFYKKYKFNILVGEGQYLIKI